MRSDLSVAGRGGGGRGGEVLGSGREEEVKGERPCMEGEGRS